MKSLWSDTVSHFTNDILIGCSDTVKHGIPGCCLVESGLRSVTVWRDAITVSIHYALDADKHSTDDSR